jgi:XRE family transcriptional regulator of biofilm formation
MQLGPRLRRFRTAKGLTQVQLSQRVKVTQGYIAQIELGRQQSPSLAVIRRLSKALQVPLTKLLGLR